MARKFLVSIDLNKNELQNAVIQNLASAPASPVAGQIYYNTSDNQIYIYNGTRWEVAGNAVQSGLLASRPAAGSVDVGTIYYATDTYLFYYSDGSTWTQTNAFGTVTAQTTYGASSGNGSATDYARSDHTHGTPALGTATPNAISGASGSAGSASTPSKEDHTHAFTPSQDLSMATYKITNLGTPSADTDAANKGYVDSVAQGLDPKASVVAATTTNGTLATAFANGQVIDGVTLTTGNRILIKNQTDQTVNGIYTVNASGAPTRSTDMDAGSEFPSAFVFVEQGTVNADTGWVCTNNSPVTLGSTNIVFVQFSGAGTYTASNGVQLVGNDFSGVVVASGGLSVGATGFSLDTTIAVRKYAASIGDGSATSYTVTHSLNTKDVTVAVYDNSSPYAEVLCDVQHTSTSAITLLFSVAPTSNQYRVVVHG
jgi:hypothetical protein